MEPENRNAMNISIKTEADIKTEDDDDIVRIVDVQAEILKGKNVRPGLLHEEEDSGSDTDTEPIEMVDIGIQCDIEPNIPIDHQECQTNEESTLFSSNAKALETLKYGVKFVDPHLLNQDAVSKAVEKASLKHNIKDSIIPLEKNMYLIPAGYFGNAMLNSSEDVCTINLPPVQQSELTTTPTLVAVSSCVPPNMLDGKLHSLLKKPSVSGKLRAIQPKGVLPTPTENNYTNSNERSLLKSILLNSKNTSNVKSLVSDVHVATPKSNLSSTKNIVSEGKKVTTIVKLAKTRTTNHVASASHTNAQRRVILTNPTLSGKSSTLKTVTTSNSSNKTNISTISPVGSSSNNDVGQLGQSTNQTVLVTTNDVPKIRVSKSLMASGHPTTSSVNDVTSDSCDVEQSVNLVNHMIPVKANDVPKIRVSKSLMPSDQPSTSSVEDVASCGNHNVGQHIRINDFAKIRVSKSLMTSNEPTTSSVEEIASSSSENFGQRVRINDFAKIQVSKSLMTSDEPNTSSVEDIASSSSDNFEQRVRINDFAKIRVSKSLMALDQPTTSSFINIASCSSKDVGQPVKLTNQATNATTNDFAKIKISKSLAVSEQQNTLPGSSDIRQPVKSINQMLSTKTVDASISKSLTTSAQANLTNQKSFIKTYASSDKTGFCGSYYVTMIEPTISKANQIVRYCGRIVKKPFNLMEHTPHTKTVPFAKRTKSAKSLGQVKSNLKFVKPITHSANEDNMQTKMLTTQTNIIIHHPNQNYTKHVDSVRYSSWECLGFSNVERTRQKYKLHTMCNVLDMQEQGISKLQQDINIARELWEERLKKEHNIEEARIVLDPDEVANYFKINNRLSELPSQIKKACMNSEKKLKSYPRRCNQISTANSNPRMQLVDSKIPCTFSVMTSAHLHKHIDLNKPITFINHNNFGQINYEQLDSDPIIYLNTNTTVTELCLENFPLFRKAVQRMSVHVVDAVDFSKFIKTSGHLYPNLRIPAPVLQPKGSKPVEKQDKFKNFLFAGCKKPKVDCVHHDHNYALTE